MPDRERLAEGRVAKMTDALEQKLMELANRNDIEGFCLEFATTVNRWTVHHRVLHRIESDPTMMALYLFNHLVNIQDSLEAVNRMADFSFMAKGYAVFADEFPNDSPENNAKAYALMAKGISHSDELEGGRIYNQGRALDRTGIISNRLSDYFTMQQIPNKEQFERLRGYGWGLKAVTWQQAQGGNPAESAMYQQLKKLAADLAEIHGGMKK